VKTDTTGHEDLRIGTAWTGTATGQDRKRGPGAENEDRVMHKEEKIFAEHKGLEPEFR
jgi:hypothetical protein